MYFRPKFNSYLKCILIIAGTRVLQWIQIFNTIQLDILVQIFFTLLKSTIQNNKKQLITFISQFVHLYKHKITLYMRSNKKILYFVLVLLNSSYYMYLLKYFFNFVYFNKFQQNTPKIKQTN